MVDELLLESDGFIGGISNFKKIKKIFFSLFIKMTFFFIKKNLKCFQEILLTFFCYISFLYFSFFLICTSFDGN